VDEARDIRDSKWNSTRKFPFGEDALTSGSYTEEDHFASYRGAGDGVAIDYARHRSYAPTLGTFTSPDPYEASGALQDSGSWNRMAYVGGDPIGFNDPKGLLRCFAWPEPDRPDLPAPQVPMEAGLFCSPERQDDDPKAPEPDPTPAPEGESELDEWNKLMERLQNALKKITVDQLMSKPDCVRALTDLGRAMGFSGSNDEVARRVASGLQSAAIATGSNIYDSRSTESYDSRFSTPWAPISQGQGTIAGWFNVSAARYALSQPNGSAVWVNAAALSRGAESYLTGTMIHELLHKSIFGLVGMPHETVSWMGDDGRVRTQTGMRPALGMASTSRGVGGSDAISHFLGGKCH
jgi:RHS repeat-associated protein